VLEHADAATWWRAEGRLKALVGDRL